MMQNINDFADLGKISIQIASISSSCKLSRIVKLIPFRMYIPTPPPIPFFLDLFMNSYPGIVKSVVESSFTKISVREKMSTLLQLTNISRTSSYFPWSPRMFWLKNFKPFLLQMSLICWTVSGPGQGWISPELISFTIFKSLPLMFSYQRKN